MPVATDRRLFLKFLGAGLSGAAATSASPLGPVVEASGPMPFQEEEQAQASTSTFLTFDPLKPASDDDLLLPRGFQYYVPSRERHARRLSFPLWAFTNTAAKASASPSRK